MAKTKGWIVTNGEGIDNGAIFCYTQEQAMRVADEFADAGYAGHIMRVKGVWSYIPVEHEVVITECEAMLTDDFDDCEEFVK